MKLLKSGKHTSKPEIVNISEHGFWIYYDGHEYYLSFSEYPWFKDATVSQICGVKMLHSNLHWEELDIDLSFDVISNPQKYPLKSKHR